MLLTLVKNNMKILLRDKIGFMFLCILPIVLIAILSSAFSEDLGKKVSLESFEIGYYIQENTQIGTIFLHFIEEYKSRGIDLRPMGEEEGLKALKAGEIAGYLILNDEKYVFYREEGFHIQAMIFEGSFKGNMYLYDGIKGTVNSLAAHRGMTADKMLSTLQVMGEDTANDAVRKEHLNADPVPQAKDYYGIVEIVFIIWFSISSALHLAELERKNKIEERIKLTPIKPYCLFLGRFIPNVAATCLQVGIALVVSTLCLKVNWGNKPLLSAVILIFEVIAMSAVGTMLTFIIKNSAVINLGMYISAFVFGFTGGSFQTYMYNFVSEDLVKWSPFYYLNRTLVELSTKGSSNYLSSVFLLLLGLTVGSFTIGFAYIHLRREA